MDPGQIVGSQVGRYRITRELARGGMGVVFEVMHENIGHRAVIKVLSADLSRDPKQQEFVQRFYQEACRRRARSTSSPIRGRSGSGRRADR